MERSIKDTVDGWQISLNRNVYMYSHSLSVKKGEHRIIVDCEDLPTREKTIGIWLYNLNVSEELRSELQKMLLKWTNQFELKVQIYVAKDEYITNNCGAE